MSHDAGLRIFSSKPITIENIVSILFKAGWSPNDHDKTSLYVEKNPDEYFWMDIGLTGKENFFATLNKEAAYRSFAGIMLTWENTDVGVSILLEDTNSIVVSMQINRMTLIDSSFSDVNWYLDKILVPLASKLTIESFIWSEHV